MKNSGRFITLLIIPLLPKFICLGCNSDDDDNSTNSGDLHPPAVMVASCDSLSVLVDSSPATLDSTFRKPRPAKWLILL